MLILGLDMFHADASTTLNFMKMWQHRESMWDVRSLPAPDVGVRIASDRRTDHRMAWCLELTDIR